MNFFFSFQLQKFEFSKVFLNERDYNQLQDGRIHWLFPASHDIYSFIWYIYSFACELCNQTATQSFSNVPVASKYATIEIESARWILMFGSFIVS